MDRAVGVRELRQNLSVYLRRVAAGERLTVTERGRPVAVLAPYSDERDAYELLIEEGRIVPGGGDLLRVDPLDRPISAEGSRAVQELRDERLP